MQPEIKTRYNMKKIFALFSMVLCAISTLSARTVLKVDGDENRYNMIRVVNATNQTNFQCRIVMMNENDEVKSVYGIYNLKENGDHDSCKGWVNQGDQIGVELPKDFPVEVNATISYMDYPMFDIVVITLTENATEFE